MANCYLCNTQIGTMETEWELNDLSLPPLGMSENDVLCNNCGKGQQKQARLKNLTKPTKWWYVVPIFLGIIGGVIMYFAVKNEDAGMANKGLILGIVLTVIGFIIYIPFIMIGAFMGI